MAYLKSLTLAEVLDARGDPTVGAYVTTDQGLRAAAFAPSGRSTGRHEAVEVRDGDEEWYGGRGVRRHLARVARDVAEALEGLPLDIARIDEILRRLDGAGAKPHLGANVTSAVSLAVAKAAALSHNVPLYQYLNPLARTLPVPQMNLINGGRHAFNETPIQEFLVLPLGAPSVQAALEWTMRVYRALSEIVRQRYGQHALNPGDEGGLTPDVPTVQIGLDLMSRAVEQCGLSDGMRFGLDMAATHLYEPSTQRYHIDRPYSRDELFDLYAEVAAQRRVISIEDPVQEDDLSGLALLTRRLDIQLVGDDLFVTSPVRVREAIRQKAGNALLWKFNQIGTLSEAWAAAELAKRHGYEIVVSERSGETEDAAIADLAVALGASQIKTGAPVRGERTAKYNRLLEIERELGSQAQHAGEALMGRYG
ncbi:MAG: enolase [Firmicutes bacterium]|nr:enolase [Bacillota bacterium]